MSWLLSLFCLSHRAEIDDRTMGGWQGKRKYLLQCHLSVWNWLILKSGGVPVSPFDLGLLPGDGLRQCKEPSLGVYGIPADSQGSRMALVAKNTNMLAPGEGEKVPCDPTEVSVLWHRLLSDEQLGTRC